MDVLLSADTGVWLPIEILLVCCPLLLNMNISMLISGQNTTSQNEMRIILFLVDFVVVLFII